jgi:hypothetical protein
MSTLRSSDDRVGSKVGLTRATQDLSAGLASVAERLRMR